MMEKIERVRSISKILSPNDIGLTGGHQAGILVPKDPDILSFFPKLNAKLKNPRYLITFIDEVEQRWEFAFIYYNNRFFGGTRNEYRLTRMTKYINSNNLKVGDELILINDEDGITRILYKKQTKHEPGKLRLSIEWKVIQI